MESCWDRVVFILIYKVGVRRSDIGDRIDDVWRILSEGLKRKAECTDKAKDAIILLFIITIT